MEFLVQPADRATVSCGGRLSFPVLGDRRATRQRRRRHADPQPACRDLHARLDRPGAPAARAVTPRPIRCIPRFSSAGWSRAGTLSRARVRTSRPSAAGRDHSGTRGRSRWSSPRPIRTRCTSPISFSTRPTNGGESWTQISPDLTREDPGVPPNLDAAAAADAPAGKRRGVIYTIAPSPVRAPLIWIGTDDGLIQVTADDGKTWQNVTPPALTSWSKVTMIDASHFDANEAYAAVERHQLEDYEPYIYRTRDGGKTWQKITKGLPAGVYVQTVKEDPVRRGLLFAGTELRRVRVVRRRRRLAVAAAQSAAGVDARLRHPRRRPDRRHARARVLGARRHHARCARSTTRSRSRTRSSSNRPTPSPCRRAASTARRSRKTSRSPRTRRMAP